MDSNISTSNSSSPELHWSENQCAFIWPNSSIFMVSSIVYVLVLLPLCILILCLCLQQWRNLSSSSSSAAAAATMSHSTCFTCHLAIMELVGYVPGFLIQAYAVSRKRPDLLTAGGYLLSFTWYGEIYLHVLTCAERYLAVVHPVTYLSLKNERGVRIRNAAVACVWLICFAEMWLMLLPQFLLIDLCLLTASLVVVSFCSLSVLYVLVRPAPGELGGTRVHQTKQRAFYCIVAILGVLVIRFTGGLSWTVASVFGLDICVLLALEVLYNLPSSLVLPLLFLHREGKLKCFRSNGN